MKATRLNHVHILVRDLDAAIAFYTNALGLTHAYSDEQDGETLAFLHVGDAQDVFTLHHRTDFGTGERLQHFGFTVDAPIDEAIAAVEAAGGTVGGRAGWNPERVFYAVDPEGYTIEIMAAEVTAAP